jgi:hypothetical protein
MNSDKKPSGVGKIEWGVKEMRIDWDSPEQPMKKMLCIKTFGALLLPWAQSKYYQLVTVRYC